MDNCERCCVPLGTTYWKTQSPNGQYREVCDACHEESENYDLQIEREFNEWFERGEIHARLPECERCGDHIAGINTRRPITDPNGNRREICLVCSKSLPKDYTIDDWTPREFGQWWYSGLAEAVGVDGVSQD